MADVPPSRVRIIPIMARRRTASRRTPSEARTPATPSTTRRLLRSRTGRRKEVDIENLRLPCLDALGLYPLPTKGDGNCLYYALSDQLYGIWDRFAEIRSRLANHMNAHRDYFINFTAVGGERRAPRRAAAAASRTASTSVGPAPTPTDRQQKFEAKVAESGKNRVWGGSEEIQAFCQSYKRDVRVYTDSGIQNFRDVDASPEEERDVIHIAFHNFEHYSSVRCIDGPHTGLPCIPNNKGTGSNDSGPVIDIATPWKISFIQEGLGGRYDHDTIVEMLRQCRGDIDGAFANLLDDAEATTSSSQLPPSPSATNGTLTGPSGPQGGYKPRLPSSRSSSRHSSASKRSADDTDDELGPNAVRRARGREQKRRILPNVTVGIAFRDEHKNDLVSLRLRVSPDVAVQQVAVEVSPRRMTPEVDGKTTEGRKLRPRKSPSQGSEEETSPRDSQPGSPSNGAEKEGEKATVHTAASSTSIVELPS